MKIDLEIEVDSNVFKDSDLLDELFERVSCKYMPCTEEHQKTKQPEIEAMQEKLAQIEIFLRGY